MQRFAIPCQAHLATQMWLDSQASKMLKEKKDIEAELRKFGWLSYNKVLVMLLRPRHCPLPLQAIPMCLRKGRLQSELIILPLQDYDNRTNPQHRPCHLNKTKAFHPYQVSIQNPTEVITSWEMPALLLARLCLHSRDDVLTISV